MPPDTAERRPRAESGAHDDGTRVTPDAAESPQCAWCHGPLPPRRKRFCCDDHRRRGQKAERVIEDDSYAAGVVRLIRKMGVRASADLEALRWLAGAAEHARGALAVAVDGCRARGYSDGEIGAALGISRQALGQRFGRKRDVHAGTPESGGGGVSRGDGLARLSQALEDRGCTVRGTSAQCPGPDHKNGDRTLSLSIGQGREGAVLNCHLGCLTDTILEILGMSAAGLFDEPREHGSGDGYQVAAEYRYTDEHGQLLFVKERRVPKDFKLRRPDGRGGWAWGLGDARRVLYNLPAVLAVVAAGQPVYVAEGEKDADAIGRAGAVATCNFEGAAKDGQRPKWRPEYGDALKGATVIVVADKDSAGYAHAAAIKADLTGKAGSVTVVEPAAGKDAYDHLAAGHGLGELRPAQPASAEAAVRRIVLTPASFIDPEPVVWAWEDAGQGRIPAGSLGLFAGREGTGKSSFLIWLAARITTGTLPGSLFRRPGAVIYVAVEDSWKFTIVPRLIAAGAALGRVYRAEVEVIEGDTVSLSLPADIRLLEEAITSHGVTMVALDPLMSAISDTLDTHVNRQVRQALDPLARMADRTGAVVAGVAHFNKSAGTDASSLITASEAFKDVARFIFAFAGDDEGQVITQTKNSLGMSGLPSLAYRLTDATVPTAKGDAHVGRLILDGPADRTVQDILSLPGSGAGRDEPGRAEEYLKKALGNGPRPTRDIEEEEAREAHRISKRTLDRARQNLRIPTAKHGSRWWISLPEHEGDLADLPAETTKDAKDAGLPGEVGTVGTVDHDWPDGSLGEAAQ